MRSDYKIHGWWRNLDLERVSRGSTNGYFKEESTQPNEKVLVFNTNHHPNMYVYIIYIYIHTIYIFMLTIHTCNMYYIYMYTYVGVSLQGCELCQLAVGNTFDSATWFGEKKKTTTNGGWGLTFLFWKNQNDQIWGRDILGTSSSSMTFFKRCVWKIWGVGKGRKIPFSNDFVDEWIIHQLSSRRDGQEPVGKWLEASEIKRLWSTRTETHLKGAVKKKTLLRANTDMATFSCDEEKHVLSRSGVCLFFYGNSRTSPKKQRNQHLSDPLQLRLEYRCRLPLRREFGYSY